MGSWLRSRLPQGAVEALGELLHQPLVGEAQGPANHSSKIDNEDDLERLNRLTAAGLAMIHVPSDMAKNHSEELVDEVRRVRVGQLRRLA